MDGSGARRRTIVTAVAALALASLTLSSLAATGAAAQSAGDEQYVDPLAGGGQEPRQSPSNGGGSGTSEPDTPAPIAPAPSSPDASTGSDAVTGSPEPATTGDETLPHTGAEPVPIVVTGLLLLLGGALLRQRARLGATS